MSAAQRKPVIHERRFWWRYDDGRMEPVQIGPKAWGHLCQVKSMMAREDNKRWERQ